ncbi:redoxin domain-containing protein [Oecophyllibacter saccharovorans]|uniref:redoxin domain-containing protein n=1 Tax=Oecophyllibacter saccharovorans TaxID=2558360 RepID=UPI0018848C57|nr:redoxin domain-containing protein [Oecophyllibacter saccharovorans]
MRGPLGRRHLLALLPVLAFLLLGSGFWRMLHGLHNGQFDPHAVMTPQLGKDVPSFPALAGIPLSGAGTVQGAGTGIDAAALRGQTGPVLINFMASWCIPCVAEMSQLKAISQVLPVWGIAYKDRVPRVTAFVRRNGQPYARLAADPDGRAAVEWGVTGVPESFLVMPGGQILWHGTSALDEATFRRKILPLLMQARKEGRW